MDRLDYLRGRDPASPATLSAWSPSIASTRQALPSALQGLSSEEALARLRRGEGNTVPFDTSHSYRRILFENAFTPINTILFAIAITLVALGLYGDSVMTAGLVLVNVVVGVVQEGRAKRQLDRIALLTRPTATVIRDGQERVIAPDLIVRGDLLVVQPGDQIQVDGSVIEAEGCSVDESLLTGESDLVPKSPGDEVFSGTFCMSGRAVYQAEKVGPGSMAQQITARARTFRTVRTPLQREVAYVIWAMAVVVIVLGAQVLNSFRQIYGGLPLVESVRAAAVIVALVPQGLSFMVTVTYAMAAVRMARVGALVQRLNAVESMSHIDILCVDKTGTLTTNELRLEETSAFGTDAEGLRRLLGDFAASSAVTNRTGAAIAEACGGQPRRVTAEVAFDSAREWSALAFDEPDLKGVFVLGAPEVLRPYVSAPETLWRQVEAWASTGLRVLLFARGDARDLSKIEGDNPSLPPLTALGLVSLRDELRPDASETAARFVEGGIALKIISGDNPQTVAALARQAGIGGDLRVRAGPDIEGLADEDLQSLAEETAIFGRIAPQHKEALVQALQRRGHYVAMTGDGVNDVPALKKAQVAVAMRSGSPVTRNVADLVLLNDSFAALPEAFREGQRIRKGMEAIIRLFLVRTIAVSLVIFGAAVLAEPFPITPRQSGVLAQFTVGLPALALAFWARPGRSGRYLLYEGSFFVFPAAITVGIASLLVYLLYTAGGGDVMRAQTALTMTGVLCGVALIPLAQLSPADWTNPRAFFRDRRTVLGALAMLLLFFVSVLIDPVRDFYELTTLPLSACAVVVAVVLGWAVVLQVLWRLRLHERVRRIGTIRIAAARP